MVKRLLSLILCLTMVVLLIPATAMAWDGVVAVLIEQGDTVYDICRSYGIDYYEARDVILALNGFDEEWQLGTLYPGNTILLPVQYGVTETYNAPAPEEDFPADSVLFYVVPYTIHNGDTIENVYMRWGMRYETYAGLIRSLNGVQDLDSLVVGTTYYLPTTLEHVEPGFAVAVVCHIMRYGENAADVFYDYGINYGRYSNILMAFNGWRDLTRLNVGDQLLIPVV